MIDTNIAIYFMKGMYNLGQKFANTPGDALFISEITLAELKFGFYNSAHPKKNETSLNLFLAEVTVIPIVEVLDLYGQEKARLRKAGTRIDDFNLLIGVTAVKYEMVMVTNNTRHFQRIDSIILEDWTKA